MRPTFMLHTLLALALAASAVRADGEQAAPAARADGEQAAPAQLSPALARVLDLTRPTAGGAYAVTFNPYPAGSGYAPGSNEPPRAVIEELLDALLASGRVRAVYLFGSRGAGATAVELAAARGLPVILTAWLDATRAANDDQIAGAIELAQRYPTIVAAVSCGSEVRLRNGAGVANAEILHCLSRMRGAGVTQPLTSSETWPSWGDEETPGERYPDQMRRWEPVASAVDFVLVSIYAWWENQIHVRLPCAPAAEAGAFHLARLRETMATYAPKPVVMSEFGWPGTPYEYRDPLADCSVASVPNQLLVVSDTLGQLRAANLSGILFAGFSESWKVQVEGNVGEYWGLCARDVALAAVEAGRGGGGGGGGGPTPACVLPPVGADTAPPTGGVAPRSDAVKQQERVVASGAEAGGPSTATASLVAGAAALAVSSAAAAAAAAGAW